MEGTDWVVMRLLVGAKCGVSWGQSWASVSGWVTVGATEVARAWVRDGLDNEVDDGSGDVDIWWVGWPSPDIGLLKVFLDRDHVVNEVHCWTVPNIAVGSSV